MYICIYTYCILPIKLTGKNPSKQGLVMEEIYATDPDLCVKSCPGATYKTRYKVLCGDIEINIRVCMYIYIYIHMLICIEVDEI